VVPRPRRSDQNAGAILGDDRYLAWGRQHTQHFFVVRVRKRSILNDAGVASHLDDEGFISGRRITHLNGRT
jgi:hypothetical protein